MGCRACGCFPFPETGPVSKASVKAPALQRHVGWLQCPLPRPLPGPPQPPCSAGPSGRCGWETVPGGRVGHFPLGRCQLFESEPGWPFLPGRPAWGLSSTPASSGLWASLTSPLRGTSTSCPPEPQNKLAVTLECECSEGRDRARAPQARAMSVYQGRHTAVGSVWTDPVWVPEAESL